MVHSACLLLRHKLYILGVRKLKTVEGELEDRKLLIPLYIMKLCDWIYHTYKKYFRWVDKALTQS